MSLVLSLQTTVVGPSLALVLFTVFALSATTAAATTALKGHWRYLLIGAVTVGLGWFYGAMLPAEPQSLWTRLSGIRRLPPST